MVAVADQFGWIAYFDGRTGPPTPYWARIPAQRAALEPSERPEEAPHG
jgi:hypothetical protein